MEIEHLSAAEIDTILSGHEGRCPIISELDETNRRKLAWMVQCPEEIVGLDHLARVLSTGVSHRGDDIVRCYVGYEPSGKADPW